MPDLEIQKEVANRKKAKKPKRKIGYLFLWVALGILIMASLTALYFNLKASGYLNKYIQSDENFYLVHLNLGDSSVSYYGQILKDSKEYLTLKDPLFIQSKEEDGQTSLILTKLTDSFYKPLPEMKISKEYIIFMQPLEKDSPIILEYNKTK